MEVYNKNRDNNHSMHDEIREQNAKLKGAPLKDKWDYFKEYYLKGTVIAAVILVILGNLVYSMVTAPRETAFVAFFFNDTGDSSDTTLIDGFIDYMGIDTKKAQCYIDASVNYSDDTNNYEQYIFVEKVMANISAEELDVIVGDEVAFDYYAKLECLSDITTILPDDLLDRFEDKLYYAAVGEDGELVPCGIYITDAPKIIDNYYYNGVNGIFGFVANSQNTDNAIEFLMYIYMED